MNITLVQSDPTSNSLTQEGTPFAVSFTLAGSTGMSAYQQWLVEGNTGTWNDFYESLRGGVTEEVQTLHDEAVAAAGRASTSETSAASSATTAEIAASGASTSADSASTSASNALSSANSAATSEANALDYKNAAAGSASNALSSENKAEQWAESPVDTEVEAGKKSALHHATKAAASETAAEGYASSAAESENSAATSASNALDSKNSAATSAGSASTSASDAATSASNASTSESSALSHKNTAQAWAEGTEPGGVGTKSSKGWADDSSASAAAAEDYSVLAADNSRLSIGTVTTGPEGTEASATIAGEPGSQTLSVTIPRGNTGEIGPDGASAYEVALGNGFVGTEAEWLASLVGEQGEQGTGIESIVRTAGDGSPGTADIYTITYTDTTTSTFTVYNGADGEGVGDMLKSTYDTNNSGVVDNAEKVNGLSVETAVPAGAVFTDTTYSNVSEFANDAGYLTSETAVTSLSLAANILTYVDETGATHDIDLSLYLDDTNLARLTNGTLDGTTGIATFTRDDASTFTVDFSALLDDTTVTVEDNLTSTSVDNALSANQGRLLDVNKIETSAIGTIVQPYDADTVVAPAGVLPALDGSNLTNVSTVAGIDDLTDVDTSTAVPATGNALVWDGAAWVPGEVASGVAAILQPTITAPLDGATGVSRTPTITLSTYYSLYGKPQQAMRIQISTVSDFANTVVDETVGAVSSYEVPTALDYGTPVYIRGAYQDTDDVWSEWASTVSVTTVSEPQAEIIGVALRSTGGPGGTWDHIDVDGNTISTPSTAWFDLHPVFGNIEDVTVDGQYMVNVPKFYYKRGTASNGDPAWWMSDIAYTGFSVMPAFVLDGVEKDSFQYGKYQASESGGKLQSVPGVMPKVSTSLTDFISLAEARNTGGVAGFRLHHYDMLLAIQWLYLIENATMDSQTETGDGRVNESSAANVDATDVAQATYRGIVGLWGNVQQWMDGVRTLNDVIERRAYNGSWASTGESVPNSGNAHYPITLRSTGDEQFIADTYSVSNGTTATIPDYNRWRNAGEYYPVVGGYWSHAANAGLWAVYCFTAASNSYSYFGARLARVL